MKSTRPWWPAALAVVLVVWSVASLFPRTEKGVHALEFGRLPVLMNGRVQPFDSLARNSLLQIRNKQTAPVKLHFSVFRPDRRGQTMSATDWLLEVLFKPETADTRKIFRIDHPELVAALKLPGPDPEQGEDGKHFSFAQLEPSIDMMQKEARRAEGRENAQRTSFDRAVLKLYSSMLLYHRLKNSVAPETVHDFAADLAAYQQAIGPGLIAMQAREAGQEFKKEDFDRLMGHLQRYEPLSRSALPLILPPVDPKASRDAWRNMGASLMESARSGELHPAAVHFATMASAFHNGRLEEFNRAVAAYGAWVGQHYVDAGQKTRAETLFNYLQPFYKALVIYTLAFLLIFVYWAKNSESLRWAGELLVWVALIIHTAGLLYRMILEGRPPVTNLYSSAVFIGWGSAILGLILERIYRVGLGAATGALIGFVTLIIAHNLAVGGDTMEMMRAVLDSNFWLATHVVTITIGYSATYLAGALGVLLIVRGVFTRSMTAPLAQMINQLIYGIVCFATFFSFVGTILGGIWADQSWGRFWGWDPKENGALIIVLWNSMILHVRWVGMVEERGMALMVVFGNVITSFSWFGVNMLGVGLHSYGFTESGSYWLGLAIALHLVLMGFGALPKPMWASWQNRAAGNVTSVRWMVLALGILVPVVFYFAGITSPVALAVLCIFGVAVAVAPRLAGVATPRPAAA